MELKNALLGDVPMLVVAGAVDHSTSDELQSAIDDLFSARYNVIFLDFSQVDYIDSGGLSVLLGAVRDLQRGWIGVIEPGDNIRRLFEISGLAGSPHLRLFETRQAARVATGERAST